MTAKPSPRSCRAKTAAFCASSGGKLSITVRGGVTGASAGTTFGAAAGKALGGAGSDVGALAAGIGDVAAGSDCAIVGFGDSSATGAEDGRGFAAAIVGGADK